MAKNTEPYLKRARALGLEPGFVGVSKSSNRNPGQGNRRKMSEYALQLNEKQKVKFVYGMYEKQFRTVFERADKMAGNTGENLLSLLERRFDNVVYRMGFASTRREAKQLVSHAHFTVNGKKANIPSMRLNVGDVVAVKESSRSSVKFKALQETASTYVSPKWLETDAENMTAKVIALPQRDDIDFPVEEQLIIELYSK